MDWPHDAEPTAPWEEQEDERDPPAADSHDSPLARCWSRLRVCYCWLAEAAECVHTLCLLWMLLLLLLPHLCLRMAHRNFPLLLLLLLSAAAVVAALAPLHSPRCFCWSDPIWWCAGRLGHPSSARPPLQLRQT